jgi:hypothetical protein
VSSALALLLACATLFVIWFLLRRANELFRVIVNQGRARHVSGRMPAALFHDIQDVIDRARVSDAVLRVVTESGVPRLLPHPGLTPVALQQLRNVVGRFNVTQIRAGRFPGKSRP